MVDISHYSNKNVYNVYDSFSEAQLSIMDQRDRVDSQMEHRWKAAEEKVLSNPSQSCFSITPINHRDEETWTATRHKQSINVEKYIERCNSVELIKNIYRHISQKRVWSGI